MAGYRGMFSAFVNRNRPFFLVLFILLKCRHFGVKADILHSGPRYLSDITQKVTMNSMVRYSSIAKIKNDSQFCLAGS